MAKRVVDPLVHCVHSGRLFQDARRHQREARMNAAECLARWKEAKEKMGADSWQARDAMQLRMFYLSAVSWYEAKLRRFAAKGMM